MAPSKVFHRITFIVFVLALLILSPFASNYTLASDNGPAKVVSIEVSEFDGTVIKIENVGPSVSKQVLLTGFLCAEEGKTCSMIRIETQEKDDDGDNEHNEHEIVTAHFPRANFVSNYFEVWVNGENLGVHVPNKIFYKTTIPVLIN